MGRGHWRFGTRFCLFHKLHYGWPRCLFDKTFVHPYLVESKSTPTWKRVNLAIHIMTVILGLGSLALFICGMLSVGGAISRLGSP